MNNDATPISDLLTRLVMLLIALFGAASRCARRVRGLQGRERVAFARLAVWRAQRGHALVYVGEDEATVDRRMARMAWIAADPLKAFRHLARGATGLARHRLCGCAAPLTFAPPVLACVACSAGLQTGPALAMEPP